MITIEGHRSMVISHVVEELSQDLLQFHGPSVIPERHHYSTCPVSLCSSSFSSTMLALNQQLVQHSTKLLEASLP